MQRTFAFKALAVLVVALISSASHAAVITSNAQIGIRNFFNPAAGPPLIDITQLSGDQTTGMIYTNQVSGIPGVSGGIRTISAQLIASATDGISFTNVVGPTGPEPRNLIAVTVLGGSLVAPGTANFDPSAGGQGRLMIYEQAAGVSFERRDPASWLAGANLLTTFDLLGREPISQGPYGEAIFASAGTVNISTPLGLLTGDSDITLLWLENQATDPDFFIVPDPSFPDVPGVFDDEKLITNAEQRTILDAVGQDIDPGQPFILDAADLAALNAIAGLGGLADLGGAGTGFATGFAAGTQTDYFIDLPALVGAGLQQGDLVAQLSSENYPGLNFVPEPASALVWLVLGCAVSGVWYSRRKK